MTGPAPGFVSWWLGWRYLRGQRRRFTSFISWVSIVGLALGVAVLVLVISVMNGFDGELKRRILGTIPHVVAQPSSPTVDATRIQPFGGGFRSFEADGMVARDGGVNAVSIVGVGDEGLARLPVLAEQMVSGDLAALTRSGTVVLGRPLAAHLGLAVGDDVTLILTVAHGESVVPRFERFVLAGTFEVGAEVDYGLLFVGWETIAERGLLDTGRAGVRFVLHDPMALADARARIGAEMPEGWRLTDWTERYGELFRAVRLEKAMMFFLLLLIVAVAAFNIVSAQTMLVNEKRADIAILRTMGASSGTILRMVLAQGVLVSLVGIGAGISIGLVLAVWVTEAVQLLESLLGVHLLDGTYFDRVPSRVLPLDVVVIFAMSLALCLASAAVPAFRAAALNPAEALHAE